MEKHSIILNTIAPPLGFLAFLALFSSFLPGVALADNSQCMMCHSAQSLSKTSEGKQVSLYVDAEILSKSSHRALMCTDCHTDLRGAELPHRPNVAPVMCTRCHGKRSADGDRDTILMRQFASSVHAQTARRGDKKIVLCKDCHGTHDIRPARDPHSMVSRANIVVTCSKCHSDAATAARYNLTNVKKIRLYTRSVHCKLNKSNGLPPSAVCTDCHGTHEILAPENPKSLVNKANISKTCGECHRKQLITYQKSIHGEAIMSGMLDAAACSDCHGTHLILPSYNLDSTVYPTNVRMTCSKCHENPKIQEKYKIPANRLASYNTSYHGIANRYGNVLAANCASCHGSHDIRPSRDSRSATNKKNLPKVCGKCHQTNAQNFAKGSVHLEPSPKKDIVVFWVGTAYRVFVSLIMLAFCGYITLDLLAHLRNKKRGNG